MEYLYIAAGLALLFFGGEGLLRGSISLARRYGLSDLLVSAVIVGFGTSAPELAVSVQASLAGSPAIALGNVVGSNIANIFLILALCVMIFPVRADDPAILHSAMAVVTASIILCALSFAGIINQPMGLCLFLGLVSYLAWNFGQDRKKSAREKKAAKEHVRDAEGPRDLQSPLAVLYCIGGLALLVFGAQLLLEGATFLARAAGISEAVIGLTLVAVGTSLPELATGVIAALRRHGDVIIGNILGSCIFNSFGILGITAMIAPMPMQGRIVVFDIWAMLAAALVLLAIIAMRRKIGRVEGIAMLAAYVAYVGWLYAAGG